ncbi:MAG: arabinosyltransferase domain-containing protein, partial [Pseudonocardiaceae bacterium]
MISAVCALAVPLLPVVQDTARIVWPNGADTRAVNAPLTAYVAEDIDATIPCETVRSIDERFASKALLLSTVPHARIDSGAGMHLQMDDSTLIAVNRGQQVAMQPMPRDNCDITVSSTAVGTSIAVGGNPVFEEEGDIRPQVVGIYSDVTSAGDPIRGLGVEITPDTRYQSAPTVWKTGATVLGVIALLGCLIAVNRQDERVARRAPRWAPVGWWKLTGRDLTVFGALGLWVFIGPVTSDDGYILSMARVADEAGYLTNYHRWFGVAEAPFGWFYHLTELMAQVSTVPPWIRLPSFVLGIISWMLISREVMPRLGKEVRRSRAAGWAAAAVFLVWWMPFNNGVRPEPVAAVGSLLAIAAVERTLVTRRLLPLCLGLLAAAFTLAATPTGLIAVAPFLVAAKPLFTLLKQRAQAGWSRVLTPIAASGLAVLMVVFADQTLATVVEATRLRTQIGPSMGWFQEFARYDLLFSTTADGSVARRFPVLLIILCTATCLVVLLRRGRIPGAALGPSRRLIGTVALFFLLLALTPTKWTHHFGAFAAVGASMAALTALATSSSVLRSTRNRNAFLAGLLVVAALAATGPNSYWFVSQLGVPWFDKPPSFGGVHLSSLLLAGAVVAGIIAFIENVRTIRPGRAQEKLERRSRGLLLGSASLTVVCGVVALAEFATMAKAIQEQRGSYSLGAANISHLFSDHCNLSDHVWVERDPVSSVLPALPAGQQRTVPSPEQDQTEQDETGQDETGQQDDETNSATKNKAEKDPLPQPKDDNGRTSIGFHTRSMGDGDPLVSPPPGFTPSTVPMWSSFEHPDGPTGKLRTQWFELSQADRDKQLVVAVSGRSNKGTGVAAEYGTKTPDGIEVVRSVPLPIPGTDNTEWADSRLE